MTFLAAAFGLLAGLVAGAAFQRWFTGAAGPEHLAAGAVLYARPVECICTPDQFQLSGHGVNCPARPTEATR